MRRTNNLIPKLHIKKGDNVRIISGDDKGKTGRVIAVYPEKRRIMVEGVNIVTKHSKPSASVPKGGRVEKEASIDISNVLLMDPKAGVPVRVGRITNNHGKLVRVSTKSREEIK